MRLRSPVVAKSPFPNESKRAFSPGFIIKENNKKYIEEVFDVGYLLLYSLIGELDFPIFN